jgi:NADP-dependent 3-hydroxy acid dehydrogenase YdfG
MKHKPLREQIIVITGASSGIGLTTARMAVQRGAKVVLAARSGDVLTRSPLSWAAHPAPSMLLPM